MIIGNALSLEICKSIVSLRLCVIVCFDYDRESLDLSVEAGISH